MIDARRFELSDLPALAELFGSDRAAAGCWCMWFVIAVRDFHAGGAAANAARFRAMAAAAGEPMGVIAFADGAPVGWAAAGPRSRYARAARTPTMQGRDPGEDADVWLVPCFLVRKVWRGRGVAAALLDAAVALARERRAPAIEAFPLAGAGRGGTDAQVGSERLFAGRGFVVLRRPSAQRVVMRLALDARPRG